jgi:hypothetical protein
MITPALLQAVTACLHGTEKTAFKLQGHTEHQGLPIAIENRKGSVRKGVDSDGKPWRTKMIHPYGYIKGSKGADGEEIDCYVGPHKDAPNVHVVHQRKSDGKTYDEDKLLLGFQTKKDAREAYLKHYNDPKFLGPMRTVAVEKLKALVAAGKRLVKISSKAPPLAPGVESLLGSMSEDETEAIERRLSNGDITFKHGPRSLASRIAFRSPPLIPRTVEEISRLREKRAAGAPTRGNFMMASDLPPFQAPRLDRVLQKESDMLPDDVTYSPGDFKMVNIMKKRAGAVSPAGRLAASQRVGLPRVTAPPGPSIKQVAKPKGPGFGSGEAGSFKDSIGGTLVPKFK